MAIFVILCWISEQKALLRGLVGYWPPSLSTNHAPIPIMLPVTLEKNISCQNRVGVFKKKKVSTGGVDRGSSIFPMVF